MKITGLNKNGVFVFEDGYGTQLGIKSTECSFCQHPGPCLLQEHTSLCICLLCLENIFATNRIERSAAHE